MTPSVLVMAKAPQPGQVKTRLEPLLGPDGCARLQAVLIAEALRWAEEVAGDAVFLACAPSIAAFSEKGTVPVSRVKRGLSLSQSEMFEQRGGDLGARLIAATTHVFDERPGPLIVIGTDAPTLTRAHASAAASELAAMNEVCFGPARDGGYYLVALSGECREVFELPPHEWGGPRVLELSMRAARAAGLSVALLDVESDLDTPADARALLKDPRLPASVAEILAPAAASS